MDREVSPPKLKAFIKEPSVEASRLRHDEDFNTFRVFSWNVNGISPFLQQSISSFFGKRAADPPKASLRTFLHRHSFPELLFLQEVKINGTDEETQRAVSKAVNIRLSKDDAGPEYRVHFTLPKDKFNARGFGGKVYGVCSIIRKDFFSKHVANVRQVSWDLEGRISVVELAMKLAIWNIYAVNGTDNPYKDPDTGQVRGTRHDRKLAFHRLLVDECKTMEADGWTHIIAGDINIAPARIDGHPNLRTSPHQHVLNRADFHKKFLDQANIEGLRAVDVWREMKGDERQYTYYSRGRPWGSSCDRVDLILASRDIWKNGEVLDAGILNTPQERGPSDHVPIWVELRLSSRVVCEQEGSFHRSKRKLSTTAEPALKRIRESSRDRSCAAEEDYTF